jgi:hypothetical protein
MTRRVLEGGVLTELDHQTGPGHTDYGQRR